MFRTMLLNTTSQMSNVSPTFLTKKKHEKQIEFLKWKEFSFIMSLFCFDNKIQSKCLLNICF